MENRISASLGLLPSTNHPNYHRRSLTGFDNLLNHLDALLLSTTTPNFISVNPNNNTRKRNNVNHQDSRPTSNLYFSSTSISLVDTHHLSSSSPTPKDPEPISDQNWGSSSELGIIIKEGWVGLTRGMGPRVLHSACFAAIGYFAFETARLTLLHQYLHHKVSSDKASD